MKYLPGGLAVFDEELHDYYDNGEVVPWDCDDATCQWKPLEDLIWLLRRELTVLLGFLPHPGAFMCMGELADDGIILLKHRDTRKYIRIDRQGHTFNKEMEPHRSPLTAFEECYR